MESQRGPNLTLFIPTYDRPGQLTGAVEAILPQLGPGERLRVLDNASPMPASSLLATQLNTAADRLEIVRHPANLGLSGNLLRAFETATTPWIWVLGDDDRVLPGALERVRQAIASATPDLCAINFSSGLFRRGEERTLRGLPELAEGLDSFSNLQFISANVYRTAPCQAALRFGYLFAYTLAPHLMLLLKAMENGGALRLCREEVVSWQPPEGEAWWSKVQQALGTWLLLDPPWPMAIRRSLARQIARESTRLGELLALLLRQARGGGPGADEARMALRLLGLRRRAWASLPERWKWSLAGCILQFPNSLGSLFLAWHGKRSAPPAPPPDQFHRC